MLLDNRVAVITGGGRGIGRAIALAMAGEGASVMVASRSREQIDSVAREIEALGGKAMAVKTDVGVKEEVDQLMCLAADRFGSLDILVNNAGITHIGPVEGFDEGMWDEILRINLTGAFLCTKTALKFMLDKGYGRIINISSVSGVEGNPLAAAYSASKAGMLGLTKTVALEMAARGITCNAICPGFVETDMTQTALPARARLKGVSFEEFHRMVEESVPMKRFLRPEEVATLAVYLASEGAGGLTGQCINYCAGLCTR